jgi:hypothetical protein
LYGRYKMDPNRLFSVSFLFISKKRKRIMQPSVLIGPGTKTLCPQPQFPIGFCEYWKFGSVKFRFFFAFFLYSSSLVKDPHFISFLIFYPRIQEVASS